MPRGILAEAKFSTWDGGITHGTVYEICGVELVDGDAYQLTFFDDNGDKFHTYYYLDGTPNNDLFQFYFQF